MTEQNVPLERTPLSQLQIFCVKVMVVVAAILVVIFFAMSSFRNFAESQGDTFKGGTAFWEGVETKLYKLADERDLPPEKKERILVALAKLSNKYKPYFDALAGQYPKP